MVCVVNHRIITVFSSTYYVFESLNVQVFNYKATRSLPQQCCDDWIQSRNTFPLALLFKTKTEQETTPDECRARAQGTCSSIDYHGAFNYSTYNRNVLLNGEISSYNTKLFKNYSTQCKCIVLHSKNMQCEDFVKKANGSIFQQTCLIP